MSGRAWAAAVFSIVFSSAAAAEQNKLAGPSASVADLGTIRAAVEAPGATAVLVNVWATWCEPCREELPEILRFYRAHRAAGLRLILISADDESERAEVTKFLASVEAGDARAFIKRGDDTAFVNAFDPSWSGALPASFLYDGRGKKQRFWPGSITAQDLEKALRALPKNQKGNP